MCVKQTKPIAAEGKVPQCCGCYLDPHHVTERNERVDDKDTTHLKQHVIQEAVFSCFKMIDRKMNNVHDDPKVKHKEIMSQ